MIEPDMNQNIDPTKEQFEQFKKLPRDTPIMMLNLIELNKTATYKDGRNATGAQAYKNYGKESGPKALLLAQAMNIGMWLLLRVIQARLLFWKW